MDFKISFPKEKIKKTKQAVLGFWVSRNVWIFLFFWIGLAIFVFFIWFSYIFQYEWSESARQEYLREKGQGVILNEKKQSYILENMQKRQDLRQKAKAEKLRDVFGIE